MQLMSTIEDQIGKLPRGLDGIYKIMYERRMNALHDREKLISQAIFSWLLCAQRPLSRSQFISAISRSVHPEERIIAFSQILSLGFRLVVEDEEQDAFRVPHLSVREFLKQQSSLITTKGHTNAARACLRWLGDLDTNRILRVTQELARRRTEKLDSNRPSMPWSVNEMSMSRPQSIDFGVLKDWHPFGLSHDHDPRKFDGVTNHDLRAELTTFAVSYAAHHWAFHCQEAKELRESGDLQIIVAQFLESHAQRCYRFALRGYSIYSSQFISASSSELFAVCTWGFEEMFDKLYTLQQPSEQEVNQDNENLLMAACRWNWPTLVAKLLRKGGSVDLVLGMDGNEHNALQIAAAQGHVDVIKILLSNNAADAVLSNLAGTALQLASFHGRTSTVKILLERKCSEVNVSAGTLGSALGAAVYGGHKAVVDLLLGYGALITQSASIVSKSIHGTWNSDVADLLLRHGAKTSGLLSQALLRRSSEQMLPVLLRYATDIGARDETGWTILSQALRSAHPSFESIRLLLEHGIDVNAGEPDRVSYLHRSLALRQDSDKITQLLVKYGADVNAPGALGRPLHQAMIKLLKGEYVQVELEITINLLVEAGATDDEYTPEIINLARAIRRNDREEVCRLLESHVELIRLYFSPTLEPPQSLAEFVHFCIEEVGSMSLQQLYHEERALARARELRWPICRSDDF